MKPQRRKIRSKRAHNRKRIGIILSLIFVAVAIVSYCITQSLVVFPGIILVVAAIYYFAGWWELRELRRHK